MTNQVKPIPHGTRRSVLQDWVHDLTFMQQSVLIAAMRGPDGVEKEHKAKFLCRWLRRCVLISAFDRRVLETPNDPGGGSYTGPSCPTEGEKDWEESIEPVVRGYLKNLDSLPHHFHLHFLHAMEILGYKHPDTRIRNFWFRTYFRFAHDMHLGIETEAGLDNRLDDNEAKWRADESRFKQ